MLRLVTLISLLLIATTTLAQSGAPGAPAYLPEFPAAARVVTDTHGNDALDTLARQVGALGQLRKMVELLAGGRRFRNQLSPAETRLISEYRSESTRLQQQAIATFNPAETGMDSPRARWFFAEGDYERDPDMRNELLKRYFSPQFRTFYLANVQADKDTLEMSRREEHAGLTGEKRSEWSKLTPPEQRVYERVFFYLGTLMLLCLVRETRKFGVVDGNPPFIRAGFRRYKLATHAGVVNNYRSWTETTRTITQRLDDWGRVISTTEQTSSTHHEAFDLVHAQGSTPVHVTGAGLRANNGDSISGLSAARRLRKVGEWVLFRNHSQNDRVAVLDGTVASMLAMSGWMIVVIVLLVFQIGSVTTFLLDANVSPGLRGFVAAFLALSLSFALYAIVRSIRARRFHRRDVPKLLPLLAATSRTPN